MAEVIQTGVAPSGAAPEGHDAAMAAKMDAKNAEVSGQQQPQDAPKDAQGELIGGKFKSQEELLTAYKELEKKLGGNKPEPKQEPKADDAQQSPDQKAAEDAVAKAGLDIDALANHYYENGSLSDDQYSALEKVGITRTIVDQYIRGVEAEAVQQQQAIMKEVGGEEAFKSMTAWAVTNMTAEQLAEYNQAVDSGDPTVVKAAVMGLAYKYQNEVGKTPNLVGGNQNGGLSGFESTAQLVEAMRDPRYDKDPAYRREVEQKLARSSIL